MGKTLRDILNSEIVLESKLPLDLPIERITSDSRSDLTQAAFFAIKGSQSDGHEFLADVSTRDVQAMVVEDPSMFRKFDRTILVKSTRQAFAESSSAWFDHPSRSLQVVGITGTNGKTTTAFLLKRVWERLNLKCGIVGTVQNQIGNKVVGASLTTPGPYELQSLFHEMVEERVSHVAVEVTSIALHQKRVAGTRFQVALFTNLTQDHLDYHGDFGAYFAAKLDLFINYGVPVTVSNIDDHYGRIILDQSTSPLKVSFGFSENADFRILDLISSAEGTTARISTPLGDRDLKLKLIGRHNLYNVLGTLATVYGLGQDIDVAIDALSDTTGAPGRLERVPYKEVNVFVDYAHSDDALNNVLTTLREIRGETKKRIITVFGCGGDRDKTKRPKMAGVVSSLSDVTIMTSDNPRTESPDAILDDMEKGILRDNTELRREADRRSAIYLALDLASEGDIVLIAGKGHEDYQIIGREKLPFDDRQVVRDYD